MTQWAYLLMAIAAGACLPLQVGVNSALARGLGNPVSAALVSFAVGTAALFAYVLVLRLPLPSPGLSRAATVLPWWLWIGGGFLGAYFVSSAIYLAPKVGATVLFMTIIFGQLLVALLLEHKGLMGFPERTISLGRIAGIALMIAGVFLTRRF